MMSRLHLYLSIKGKSFCGLKIKFGDLTKLRLEKFIQKNVQPKEKSCANPD